MNASLEEVKGERSKEELFTVAIQAAVMSRSMQKLSLRDDSSDGNADQVMRVSSFDDLN